MYKNPIVMYIIFNLLKTKFIILFKPITQISFYITPKTPIKFFRVTSTFKINNFKYMDILFKL